MHIDPIKNQNFSLELYSIQRIKTFMIGTILAHLFLSKHNSYLKIYSVYVTI